MIRDFRFRDGTAIAQIVIFSFVLALGLLCLKQRRTGWFSFVALSIFRIISGSCMLATLYNNRQSIWVGVFVCESFGLVVLVYLLIEQLQRVNRFVKVISKWTFRLPDLVFYAGIGVTIAEFVMASGQDDGLEPNAMTQAGLGLFVAVYGVTVVIFAVLALRWRDVPGIEKRGLTCFAATFPCMVVRIAYSVVYAATGIRAWSAVVGKGEIYLGMTLIQEVVVVAICAWAIFSMAPSPDVPGELGENKAAGDRDRNASGSEVELRRGRDDNAAAV